MIGKVDLERAFSRVAPFVIKTPLLHNTFLDKLWQAEVYVKCEQFQPIGAFKIRGAANFVEQLNVAQKKGLFITHSSGNHAQAVAFMAHRIGAQAIIVMPNNSSVVKKEMTRRWGAQIVECEPTIEARLAAVQKIQNEKGGIIIPPFDHEWIIAGQATCAMDIISNKQELDVIAAPLGGGGLLSGTALAVHFFAPHTKVIGCEPEGAADGYAGLKSGKRVESAKAATVADGLRTTVGEIPFGFITRHVTDIWLAPEAEIIRWMKQLWSELKVMVEPSAAVAFAAVDAQRENLKGKKVAVIVSGGNVGMDGY